MSRRKRTLPDTEGTPCAICFAPIPRSLKNGRPRRYCSDDCTRKSRSNRSKVRICAHCGNETQNKSGFCSPECHSASTLGGFERPADIERRFQAARAIIRHNRRNGAYAETLESYALSRTSDPCVDFANIERGDSDDDMREAA